LGSSPILPPDTTSQGDVSAVAFALSALAISLAVFAQFFNTSLDANLFLAIEIVAAALPWVVVWMQARWPLQVNVSGDKKDPRPSMVFVLLGSGFCLLATQFKNLQIEDFSPLLGYGCAIAVALTCALFLASPRDQRSISKFLQLLILVAFYGYGIARQANTLFDRSPARQYSARVTDKATHAGRRGGTNYSLLLDAWGPAGTAEQTSVNRDLYESVEVGGTVCITARDGALYVPWYTIHPCE
jgi:hypothetical protein